VYSDEYAVFPTRLENQMNKVMIGAAILASGLFCAAPALADPTPAPTPSTVGDAGTLPPGALPPDALPPGAMPTLPPGATVVMLPPDAPPTDGENDEDDEVMLWW
jgi:hypothetical protein